MRFGHKRPAAPEVGPTVRLLACLLVLMCAVRCSKSAGPRASLSNTTTLRVGIGGMPLVSPQGGLRQFVFNLSLEGLVNFNEDGRPRPWLAEGWTVAPAGLPGT